MGENRGGGGGPEHTKLRLHGLFTQVRNGPADQDVQGQPQKTDDGSKEGEGEATLSPLAALDGGAFSSPPQPPTGEISSSKSSISAGSPRSSGPAMIRGRSVDQAQSQLEAWRDCGSMSQEEAMKTFLLLLYSVAPYWKYEQFI